MHPNYHDITSRIAEPPVWYTLEGFPRYSEFGPHQCNIYARYSALFEIKCQDCGRSFLIGQDVDEYYNLTQIKIDASDDAIFGAYDDKLRSDFWLLASQSHFTPRVLDQDGKSIYRHITIEDYVKNWGYGDPPNHDCVGDTMGCIEIGTVQVWDANFGQVVEDNKLVVWGEPKRLEELEGFKFPKRDWYKFYD